jgi:DNA-damage-inducible protein J
MPRTPITRTAIIRGRVDARRKDRVDRIFHQLGLTTTEAINLFYAQIEQRNGLPFDVVLNRLPSPDTAASLKEDLSQRPTFKSVDSVMQSLRNHSQI